MRFLIAILILIPSQLDAQLIGPEIDITQDYEVNICSPEVADLDGDGDLDIVSASFDDHEVFWYENEGLGEFGTRQIISTDAYGPRGVFTADLDGDGDMDVLSASDGDSKIAWYPNDGSGSFGSQEVIAVMSSQALLVHAADLDNDGDMDIIGYSYSNNEVAWFENDGQGNFGLPSMITTSVWFVRTLTSGDVDLDGDLDILTCSINDDKIAWYENDGQGNFGPQLLISTQTDHPSSIYFSDLDNDGDGDVLATSDFENNVVWYENYGEGDFGPKLTITDQSEEAYFVHAADLDGDGDMDVLSASNEWEDADRYAWYENDGSGYFGDQQVIPSAGQGANGIIAADLDMDGDMDVLTTSQGIGKIAWHENLTGHGCTDPSACNYDPESWLENGSCCYSDCGCTDPLAENFSSTAMCDDGSCTYLMGCTSPEAVNYDPAATADNDSCVFTLQGLVYFDENENGVLDSAEYGLPMQTILLELDGTSLITNDNGEFLTEIYGNEGYVVTLQENPLFPFFTTPQTLYYYALDDGWNGPLLFGISNEQPDYALDIAIYPTGSFYPCDTINSHSICFRNTGNTLIDAVVAFEYGELFQGFVEISPIDSVISNTIYWSVEQLHPGELICYDIDLLTPTVGFFGFELTSSAQVWGYVGTEQVAYGFDNISISVACAYDPNDKQVFPTGYSEEHYVPQDDFLEYLVRFQNTGNAYATHVIIRDTIQEGFDFSTFQIVANSHPVFTTVDPETRELEFYFQNIQLPDSISNEPESHGFISYRIRPEAETPLLTELNNTAHIFFDNNPPIVTNTTWSTLYDCSLFEVSFTDDGALLTASQGDNYQWYLDGELIEGANGQEYLAVETGDYSVQVGIDFPCLESSSSTFIIISSLSELANSQILLFPNPMTTSAVIDLGKLNDTVTLDLYDLSGKLIRTQQQTTNSGELRLERGDLASGSYLLRIISTDESFELPFVVK